MHQEQKGTAVGRDASSSGERAVDKRGGGRGSGRECGGNILRERGNRGGCESRDGGDGETRTWRVHRHSSGKRISTNPTKAQVFTLGLALYQLHTHQILIIISCTY